MDKHISDIIVVGAGPAGNNAARELSALGYGVSVIDSRIDIGNKLCTGIVGVECLRNFPADSSLIYRSARQARVMAPNGLVSDIEHPNVQAHIIDRVSYVAAFAAEARRLGAKYYLGHRVVDIQVSPSEVIVKFQNGAKHECLIGRAVVLACGFGSGLPPSLGFKRLGDFATGFQGEVIAHGLDRTHIFIGKGVAPGFFGWLVPTTAGKALIGLLARKHGQAHLVRLFERLQNEGTVSDFTKPIARWGVPLRPLPSTFANRVVVVGDAAGQVKPTTGGGIYYSLLASNIAARTIHKGFQINDLSRSQLSNYHHEWQNMLSKELEIGYSARRMFEFLNDKQIAYLIGAIEEKGIGNEIMSSRHLSFDWHSGPLTKLFDNPFMNRALSFVNPILATLAHKP